MNKLSILNKQSRTTVIIVCLGALFYCYEYLLRILPSGMMQQVMSHYQINASGLWSTLAYYYAYVPMQIPAGMLIDKYGIKTSMLIALVFCLLGNFLFGFGGNLWIVKFGRFILGFSSAFTFVSAIALVSYWSPNKFFYRNDRFHNYTRNAYSILW